MEKEIEDIIEAFRTQFDELGLKPPKNSMKNLERELIIDYWRKAIKSYGDKRAEDVKARIRKVINPVNEILN